MTSNVVLKMMGVAAILTAFAACSGDDGGVAIDAGPDAPAGCAFSDAKVTIEGNHAHSPHMLVVTSADVQAAIEKTYEMGTAPHLHMVTVTAADFTMLKAGGTVIVTSTEAVGTTHIVTISCA